MNFHIWLPQCFVCFFFFESLSCAALYVQVDVSALDKMGFWISVLCCIFTFKQMWAHFATPSFGKLLTFCQARISKDIVFSSFGTPLRSPHSSLRALLMLPWFLELALLGFSNRQNLLGMPGKSASSQVRAWDHFAGKARTYFCQNFKVLLKLQTIFRYLFTILLVLW